MSAAEQASLSAGSVWRRWDPHLHLPGTLFNDQFGDLSVPEALDRLAERRPEIEAVGITDYFSTTTYRQAARAWESGAGAGIAFLFPNVEMRLQVPTTAGAGVNVHLLCSPQHVDFLDQFIARLEFTWSDQIFRADEQGLTALGRAFRNNPQLDAHTACREGAKQFKVNFDQLRQIYRGDAAAQERLLVAFAGGEGDGTSGVRTADGAFAASRQSFERFAHIIFSGNPQQCRFWLGLEVDPPERIVEVYGGLKPCLHGSDAHSESDLGVPNKDRNTWIKGDPNFDTLRLACLAPETRVSIGEKSPADGQDEGRISSVTVDDRSWFTPGTVPMNAGLVAIIGARGSGKTALADVLAAGAGSKEPFDNRSSFLRRARDVLGDCTSRVEWHGDDPSENALGAFGADSPDEGRVRYLSQQFVERLCASDGVSDELLVEIQRVIFEAWPVDQRQGAVDFDDFLSVRLSSARDRQQVELETIGRMSDDLAKERALHYALPALKQRRQVLSTGVKTLSQQIDAITQRTGGAHAERYGVVGEALTQRQASLQAADRRRTDLTGLRDALDSATRVQFPQFAVSLRGRFTNTGLDDETWKLFVPRFSEDTGAAIDTAIQQVEAEIASLQGVKPSDGSQDFNRLDPARLVELSVAELKHEKDRLEALVGLDRKRADQLRRLQEQATESRARLEKLATQIAEAEGAESRIAELAARREVRYAAYFDAILEEERELTRLYQPLRTILQGYGKSVARLDFSVRRRVDLSAWASRGEDLIDLRTAGAFRGTGEIARIAREVLLPSWETGNGVAAAKAIQSFVDTHAKNLRDQSRVNPSDESAYRAWERRVAQWLYSVDHIEVVYTLDYDGLDVQRLSPGTRGIVLLLLYLAVDQTETAPLIIDQPEENLDPESIYTELVSLFRDASARRQIVMVTHNANLVVNTDVDQVVVAHCGNLKENSLPEFSYFSGGLENPEIRKAVCDVLEGGEEAFRQRARRLHIDSALSHSALPQPDRMDHQ